MQHFCFAAPMARTRPQHRPRGTTDLARLRVRKGLSQAALAAKLGVTPQAVGAIESGRHETSTAIIAAIAEALGYTPGRVMEAQVATRRFWLANRAAA